MSGSYSLPLVVVSVLIAMVASYTTLDLASSLTVARGRARAAWLAGGSLAMGAGIWSMHFVGMLAFRMPGMAIAYDVPLLFLSVAVAVAASALALGVVCRERVGTAAMVAASLAMGAAIAGMHYIGMWSMHLPGGIRWNPWLVAASVAIAVGASFGALWIALRTREDRGRRGRDRRMVGAVAMGAAIAGMHYTGMAAARFIPAPGPTTIQPGDVLATSGLAVAVSGTTLLILAIAVAGSVVDRELTRRGTLARENARLLRETQILALQLQEQAVELEQQVEQAQSMAVYLEETNEELRVSTESLRESEERFRQLAETIDEVFYVTSVDPPRLEYLGPAFERVWGRGVEEIGRDPRAFTAAVHPDDRDRALAAVARQIGGEATSEEYRIVRPDGEVRWIHDRAYPLRDDLGRVFRVVGSASDVSARRRAAETQHFLAEASAAFARTLRADTLLAELARLAVPALGDWCAVYQAMPDGTAHPVALAHRDPARVALLEEHVRRFPVLVGEENGAGHTLATGEAQLLPEIPEEILFRRARDAEELRVLRSLGLRSYLCVAVRAGGRRYALSVAMAESGRRLEAGDLALAADLAARAELALDNARLFEEAQRARGDAERLQHLTAALSRAATAGEVHHAVMHDGVAALGADAGVLALLGAEGDELEIAASIGYPPEACMGPGRRWPAAASIPVAAAARDGRAVLVPSAGAWVERFGDAYRPPRDGAWAAIPVEVAGRPAGALLWSYFAPRDFDTGDVTLMETLAQLCSQALERARLYEAEHDAREAAEQANQAKTEFLSAMSHELRTPLNAIGGYVELLEMGVRGPINDEQRVDLGRVGHAQRVLLGLINDILNFARIEAGRLELRNDRVRIAPVLEALDALVQPQVGARGLTYACRLDTPGAEVCGDADRIQQVLLNLVSNAIKFTDPGGRIDVWAGVEAERVSIRVSDTGRGIPPEKLDAIFDPFVQIDRHRTEESQQGVGLGLAISRDLARSMAGELEARSTPGEGSTFTLTLPLAPPE